MKNIFKTFGIIAIIAVIGFSMAACGDSGEETPPISAFAGTWNASNGRSIYIDGDYFEYRVITDKTYDGNFSVSGSKITFNATGKGAASGKYALSGDTLTLSNHTWDTAVNGTYTKVGDGGDTVVKTMTFEEFDVWNVPGEEGNHRWGYQYKDASNSFDLSGMYANNKAYLFTYSLKSDIDIDDFGIWFHNEPDWKNISNWATLKWDCKKNTRYNSSVFLVPNADAAGTLPANNFLEFYNKNRNVDVPATVSFYQFSLEVVEIATLNSVTANGDASSTTTQLTLALSKAITGLSADDITLSGVDGVTKGTLSGSGTTYTLPISGFTKGGTLNIALEKSGYVFKNWLKTATIYYKSGSSGGGDNEGTFNSLDDFKNWLNGKGNNSKGNPFKIKLKLPSLSGLLDFLKGSLGKFLDLDLSGSNLTSIGANAFDGLSNLTGITLPSGITSIGANAFKDCTNLDSVTFDGTIPSGSFDINAFIGLGDLRDKYLAGGIGTYTRPSGGTTWTKQGGGGTDIASFAGTWNASGNRSIVFSGSSFTYKVNGTTTYSGTFSVSGSTITFNATGLGTASGDFSLSGTTLTLSNHTWDSSVNGTYTKDGGSVDSGSWTAVVDSKFGSTQIRDIAWGNGKFVAVGDSGKMAYSSDGINWTIVGDSKFGSSEILSIAYGNNKFVAVGGAGKMAYSSDGTSWTAVTNSTFEGQILGIIWGNDKFVAIAGSGKTAYSYDGINWTANDNSTIGTSRTLRGIAYGNNKFVTVGSGGVIAYSMDGINWTKPWLDINSPFYTGYYFYDIAWGNNKFVAVSEGGKMAHSSDGTNWTEGPTTSIFSGNNIYVITYGNNKFVATGTDGKIATSTDGTTWTPVSTTAFDYVVDGETYQYLINAVAWGNDKFVAVCQYGRMAYSSTGD